MSSLELKGLMSLGAKMLETGQASGANCDLAERQERNLHRRPIKFLPACWSQSQYQQKDPSLLRFQRIWVGEKALDKESKDTLRSTTPGLHSVTHERMVGRSRLFTYRGCCEDEIGAAFMSTEQSNHVQKTAVWSSQPLEWPYIPISRGQSQVPLLLAASHVVNIPFQFLSLNDKPGAHLINKLFDYN